MCTCSFKASRILYKPGSTVTLGLDIRLCKRTKKSTRELGRRPTHHESKRHRNALFKLRLPGRSPLGVRAAFFPGPAAESSGPFPAGNDPRLSILAIPASDSGSLFSFLDSFCNSAIESVFLCSRNLVANHLPVSARNSSDSCVSLSSTGISADTFVRLQPAPGSPARHVSSLHYTLSFFNVNRQNGQGDQVLRSAWRMHPLPNPILTVSWELTLSNRLRQVPQSRS